VARAGLAVERLQLVGDAGADGGVAGPRGLGAKLALQDLVEGALNMDAALFGVRSPWVPRFNTDEITRPDMAARYEGYTSAIGAGWMSVNEAREAEGLPPMTAGAAEAARSTDAAHERSHTHGAAMQMPNITINQPAVTVQPQEIRNEITTPTPIINVAAQPITIDNQISVEPTPITVNVPQGPAPVVNIETVKSVDVNRGRDGRITGLEAA
jgi:hypothetical protein